MAQLDVSRSDVEERSDAPTRGWPLRPTYPANAPERAVMPRLTAPRLFRQLSRTTTPVDAPIMPADRLLETLLRSLQTWTDQQDTPRYSAAYPSGINRTELT